MATITIKNLPDEVHERLKQCAAEHRRSVNSEAIVQLERSLKTAPKRDPRAIIERIRRLNREVPLPDLTDGLLERAKREGRP